MDQTQTKKLNSIGNLFSETFNFTKEHFKNLILISVFVYIPFIVLTGLQYLFDYLGFYNSILYLILTLAAVVLSLFGEIVLFKYVLTKKLEFDIKTAFTDMAPKKFFSFLWVNILVAIITLGGTILFIIPGIYFGVAFTFAVYVLLDKEIKGYQALKESKRLVKGYWWAVSGRFILLGLIVIAIMLVLFPLAFIPYVLFVMQIILGLILLPISTVYYVNIYENLKNIKN